jgi:hypothetical protein
MVCARQIYHVTEFLLAAMAASSLDRGRGLFSIIRQASSAN